MDYILMPKSDIYLIVKMIFDSLQPMELVSIEETNRSVNRCCNVIQDFGAMCTSSDSRHRTMDAVRKEIQELIKNYEP